MAKDNKLSQIFAVRKDTYGIDCLFSNSQTSVKEVGEQITHINTAVTLAFTLSLLFACFGICLLKQSKAGKHDKAFLSPIM